MIRLFTKPLIFLILFQNFLFAQNMNIDDEVRSSVNSNKPIVLFLYRIGCSYCNSMEEFTLDGDEVKEYLESNFKLLFVNVTTDDKIIYQGKTLTGLDFAINVGYNFYPSTLFLNKQGKIDHASVGYENEHDFLVLLQFMKSGAFKDMNLESYKKSIGYLKNNDDEIVDERRHER